MEGGDAEFGPLQRTQSENDRDPEMLICSRIRLPKPNVIGLRVKFLENPGPEGGEIGLSVPPCPEDPK